MKFSLMNTKFHFGQICLITTVFVSNVFFVCLKILEKQWVCFKAKEVTRDPTYMCVWCEEWERIGFRATINKDPCCGLCMNDDGSFWDIIVFSAHWHTVARSLVLFSLMGLSGFGPLCCL